MPHTSLIDSNKRVTKLTTISYISTIYLHDSNMIVTPRFSSNNFAKDLTKEPTMTL